MDEGEAVHLLCKPQPSVSARSRHLMHCRISGELLGQYRRSVDDISRQLLPPEAPLIAKTLASRPKEPLSNGQASTSAPLR